MWIASLAVLWAVVAWSTPLFLDRTAAGLVAAQTAGVLATLVLLGWAQRSPERSRWLQLGFIVALVHALVASVLIGEISPRPAVLCGLSAFAGFMVVTGVAPYVERRLAWNSHAQWADLSQPYGSPLVAELQAKAPTVFEQSRSAAEIAVAAGTAVGADPWMVRAAAMHVHVGRLHAAQKDGLVSAALALDLSPELECLVEFDHVKDSVEACRDYDMPPLLAQLVSEHHGTLVLRKALEEARALRSAQANEMSLEPFRYPGPKPSTKESAAVQTGWFLAENGVSSAALAELETAVINGEWADSGLSEDERSQLLKEAERSAFAQQEASGSAARGAS